MNLDATAFLLFESTVVQILDTPFADNTVSCEVKNITCADFANTTNPVTVSSSASRVEAATSVLVNYDLSFTAPTANSTQIYQVAAAIERQLNDSITSTLFTRLLRRNAGVYQFAALEYAVAVHGKSRPTKSALRIVVDRTAPPSSKPTTRVSADASSAAALTSAMVAGIIVGAVVFCGLLVVLLVYIGRHKNYLFTMAIFAAAEGNGGAAAPDAKFVDGGGDDVAVTFAEEYPNNETIQSVSAMTPDTRSLLQKIQQKRNNPENTHAIFASNEVASVFVNKDRGLYAERINTLLYTYLADLTEPEVLKLLAHLKMSNLEARFTELGITGRVLAEIMTLDDLEACELVIPKPVARAFIKSLDEFRLKGVARAVLK